MLKWLAIGGRGLRS